MKKSKSTPSSPFENEDFVKWCDDNSERLFWFESLPDKAKAIVFAQAEYWYKKASAGWGDALELLDKFKKFNDELKAMLPEERKRGALGTMLANLDAIEALKRQREIFAKGRMVGVAVRKMKASDWENKIRTAIAHLFDDGDKLGWRKTNEEIVDFLMARNHQQGRKRSTVLNLVKAEAAKHRAKEKNSQA